MNFPVNDWENIPIEVYKPLLLEVKERFEAIPGETVSVTEKSIKCLFGFLTFYFGVGVFLLTNHYYINWFWYVSITVFSALIVYKGYKVIRVRPSHNLGLLPENVLSKDFEIIANVTFTEVEKEKLFYYNAIKTYSQKIVEGTIDIETRAAKYDSFFRFLLSAILLITFFLLFTISYHPEFVKS